MRPTALYASSPFLHSSRSVARVACSFLLCAGVCASSTLAQTLTPTFRSGNNYVGAGPVFGGPLISHHFNNITTTQDPLSVADGGGGYLPPTSASSDLEAILTPRSLALSMVGSGIRGSIPFNGNGAASATAQANDQWNFNISQTTCFTLDASVDVFLSTGAQTTSQGFQIGLDGGGGGFVLADGTNTVYLSAYLNATGATTRHFSGTIAAGNYFLTLSANAEGNGAPRSATVNNWVTLTIGAPTTIGTPSSATACAGHAASFSIPAVTGASYQWQIQTAGDTWQNLTSSPGPINCPGGGTGTAYATPANSPTVTIGINACPGTLNWPIRCLVSNTCGGGASPAATLTICAGDFNCDATVDFFDYLDFVDAFSSQASTADVNHDGVIDFFDYLDFVDAFSAGC